MRETVIIDAIPHAAELERTAGRYGLLTMRVGGGIGAATVVEPLG